MIVAHWTSGLILIVHPDAPLDKAFSDNYSCIVASNKQHINWKEVNQPENLEIVNSSSECGFV